MTIEEKYNELASDVLDYYKYYWERKESLDYISKVCGEPDELEPELERIYEIVDTLGKIKDNSSLIVGTEWYEEKRGEIRKRIDDNIDFYKRKYGAGVE